MNLKNDERKIELKIAQMEADLVKEFRIEVYPHYTIKQVKGFIDSTQNIGLENIILKKITDELSDEMIVDQIRRTKKDSGNIIHLSAKFLVKTEEIIKAENYAGFGACANEEPASNLQSETDSSDESSIPNLLNAMSKCDKKQKNESATKMLNEKRKRTLKDYDDEEKSEKDFENFGDEIVEKNYKEKHKGFEFKEIKLSFGGEDHRREEKLKYFDPHVIEYQEERIVIRNVSYEEMRRKFENQSKSVNERKNQKQQQRKNSKNFKNVNNNNNKSNNYNEYNRSSSSVDCNFKSRNAAPYNNWNNKSFNNGIGRTGGNLNWNYNAGSSELDNSGFNSSYAQIKNNNSHYSSNASADNAKNANNNFANKSSSNFNNYNYNNKNQNANVYYFNNPNQNKNFSANDSNFINNQQQQQYKINKNYNNKLLNTINDPSKNFVSRIKREPTNLPIYNNNNNYSNMKIENFSQDEIEAEEAKIPKSTFSELQEFYSRNIADGKDSEKEYSESDLDEDEIEYESVTDLMVKILDIEDETKELEKQRRLEIEKTFQAHMLEIKIKEEKEKEKDKDKESLINKEQKIEDFEMENNNYNNDSDLNALGKFKLDAAFDLKIDNEDLSCFDINSFEAGNAELKPGNEEVNLFALGNVKKAADLFSLEENASKLKSNLDSEIAIENNDNYIDNELYLKNCDMILRDEIKKERLAHEIPKPPEELRPLIDNKNNNQDEKIKIKNKQSELQIENLDKDNKLSCDNSTNQPMDIDDHSNKKASIHDNLNNKNKNSEQINAIAIKIKDFQSRKLNQNLLISNNFNVEITEKSKTNNTNKINSDTDAYSENQNNKISSQSIENNQNLNCNKQSNKASSKNLNSIFNETKRSSKSEKKDSEIDYFNESFSHQDNNIINKAKNQEKESANSKNQQHKNTPSYLNKQQIINQKPTNNFSNDIWQNKNASASSASSAADSNIIKKQISSSINNDQYISKSLLLLKSRTNNNKNKTITTTEIDERNSSSGGKNIQIPMLKAPNSTGLCDHFEKIKNTFANLLRARLNGRFNPENSVGTKNFIKHCNDFLCEVKKVPIVFAFNYSSNKKLNIVLDIDNTFLHAENIRDKQSFNLMTNYAKERNIQRHLMNLNYKGKEMPMSFVFRNYVKEFFLKFNPYVNFFINSKGLDVYVDKVVKFVEDEFKVKIPKQRIQGRIESQKGKSLKDFKEFNGNEERFLKDCIIIDDKPENWEGVFQNVITSHKYISFSKENLTYADVKERHNEMFPFFVGVHDVEKVNIVSFHGPEVFYGDCAPIFLEYENSFNCQFKYLNEMLEVIFKISLITDLKMQHILNFMRLNIFLGYTFNLDYFVRHERDLENKKNNNPEEDKLLSLRNKLKFIIKSLGGLIVKLDEADCIIVHSKKISSFEFLKNKNVLNCKFITDSLLNMKIPDENIDCYREFAYKNE